MDVRVVIRVGAILVRDHCGLERPLDAELGIQPTVPISKEHTLLNSLVDDIPLQVLCSYFLSLAFARRDLGVGF